jgi:hypothetical protein
MEYQHNIKRYTTYLFCALGDGFLIEKPQDILLNNLLAAACFLVSTGYEC